MPCKERDVREKQRQNVLDIFQQWMIYHKLIETCSIFLRGDIQYEIHEPQKLHFDTIHLSYPYTSHFCKSTITGRCIIDKFRRT
jgi:hypothetical protein